MNSSNEYKPNPPKKQRHGFKTQQLKESLGSNFTNDDIHSRIELCPVMTAFIDTRPFQRLRYIKQLGTSEYVYMTANHTRFEHSLGVAYLAELQCRKIQTKQPQLGCTGKDVLCVKLAGLLHDIGHGMFSHSYEDFVHQFPTYLKKLPLSIQQQYEEYPQVGENWCHEEVSLQMIDALLEELGLAIDYNNLDEPLKQISDGVDALSIKVFGSSGQNDLFDSSQVLTSRDFVFIKECIYGKPLDLGGRKGTKLIGRPHMHQEWLYNIVSNPHSGFDVDKMDYFARDQRRALRGAGEVDRIFLDESFVAWGKCTKNAKDARFCSCNSRNEHRGQHLMICYPSKLTVASINFFQTRCRLHSTVYQHKTTTAVNCMVMDILNSADPYFTLNIQPSFEGQQKKAYSSLPLSRSMHDYSCLLKLKDCLIQQIENTTAPELAPARELIDRLNRRQLYKCVGHLTIENDEQGRRLWRKSEDLIASEMLAINGRHQSENTSVPLERGDFIVTKSNIHWGAKDQNPVKKMRFLDKLDLTKLDHPIDELPEAKEFREGKFSAHLPRSFQELKIRVYARSASKTDLVRHVFKAYEFELDAEMEATPDGDGTLEDEERKPAPVMLSQDDGCLDDDEPLSQGRQSIDGHFFISPQKL